MQYEWRHENVMPKGLNKYQNTQVYIMNIYYKLLIMLNYLIKKIVMFQIVKNFIIC